MRRAFPRLLVLAALLSVAACDEEMVSLESGTPSTLDVRVYVDANGNGAFDSSDQPIGSATVTLSGEAGDQTATSGSDGLARFEGVMPGGYTLSISAQPPSGIVLASAATPSIEAEFRGGQIDAEFRFAFQPGSVSGRLFRDDNDNQEFDADADLAAVGIPVDLFAGSSASGDPVASTMTDGEGLFEFGTLRPGTYTVRVNALETMELEGGTTRTVEVGPGAESSLNVLFTGTLLIDMADARTAPEGQTVTVRGVISWAPGFDDRVLYLQDESAGISVFDFNLPEGLTRGTRVEITGTRGSFAGEVQISPVIAIEVLGSASTPVPQPVAAVEINAGEFQGQLVSIDGVVEQVDVLRFDNQMVRLRDEAGETFAVKVDSRTGVGPDTWVVGETFGVTGVLGTDTDESGTDIEDDHPHRIEVRGPDDVQRGGATTPIADARANVGSTVVVQGVVTWAPGFDDRVLFLQDETAGISLFDFGLEDFTPADGFQMGDLVRIRATVGAFRGEVQLEDVEQLEVMDNVAVPSPMGVTGAQLNAGQFQGELVSITATVLSVDVPSFDNQFVTLQDAAGTQFHVFSDGRTGVKPADWTVGSTVRVSGVVGADDRNDPAARIELRGSMDLAPATAGVISVAEARAMTGETVTVEAVVTRVPGWDDRVAFVQDETAGLSLFSFSLPELSPGDRVRLTGEISAFRGETQMGPDDVQVLAVSPVPDPAMVSGAQINDGLFQGQLVQAGGTVVSVEVVNDFGTQEVLVQDLAGAVFRVLVDNRTGLSEADWTVGQEVTIVGVLGFNEGDDPGARLEVIRSDDVTFGS